MVLFCHITSRIEGDKDQNLLREKGGTGFPTLLWLDAEGEILAKQGERSVEGFRKTHDALQKIQQLQDKADKSAEDEVELFLARVALGQLDFEEAQQTAKTLQASGELAERVAAAMLELEIQSRMKGLRSQDDAIAAGKHFAGMVEDGRVPTSKGVQTAQFWMIVSEYAYDQKNKELLQKCLAGVQQALDNNERYQRVYDGLQKKIDEIDG